jgi:hypothetical protein
MAIASPNDGVPPQVVATTRLSNQGPNAPAVLSTATSNRTRSKGAKLRIGIAKQEAGAQPPPVPSGFTPLDQLILSLDSAYDQLTPTQQTKWTTLAAAYTWSLCANCQPDSSGKKLYRQTNYFRRLIGLTQLDDPTGLAPPFSKGYVLQPYYTTSSNTPPTTYVQWGVIAQPEGTIAIANIGRQLNNPWVVLHQSWQGAFLTSGPGFNFVVLLCTWAFPQPQPTNFATIPFCYCTPDGLPLISEQVGIEFQP